MNKIIAVLLSISSSCLLGQENSPRYKAVTKEDLALKICPIDSEAEAFFIYNIGSSHFEENNEYFTFEQCTRIKIVRKSADPLATVRIGLHNGSAGEEILTDLEACAYNLEGGNIKVTYLDKKLVYEKFYGKYYKEKTFAIPDVREGTIIEYKYSVRSIYNVYMRPWKFQNTIPTLYSSFIFGSSPLYAFMMLKSGRFKYDTDTICKVHKGSPDYLWVIKNVPAFKDNSFLPDPEDYIQKIKFQLSKIYGQAASDRTYISTWEEAVTHLLEESDYKNYMNSSASRTKEILKSLQLDTLNLTGKIKAIVEYVKNGYKWNQTESIYCTKSKNQFLNEKQGNAAEINLFLTDLLNRAGLEAYPLILSTRKNGKIFKGYPFLLQFNSVITMVIHEKDTLLTDATEPLLPFDMIPSACLNGEGLRIKSSGKVAWFPLKEHKTSEINALLNLKYLDKVNQFQGDCLLKYTGYYAYQMRKVIEDSKEKVINSIVQNGVGTLDSVKIINEDNAELPLIIQAQVKFNPMLQANQLILFPFALNFRKDNPFKEKKRDYPMDLDFTYKYSNLTNLTLPHLYKIKQIPSTARFNITRGGMEFFYQSELLTESNLQLSSVYQTTKTKYSAKDYVNIKEFYQQMSDKLEEPVVLVKIE